MSFPHNYLCPDTPLPPPSSTGLAPAATSGPAAELLLLPLLLLSSFTSCPGFPGRLPPGPVLSPSHLAHPWPSLLASDTVPQTVRKKISRSFGLHITCRALASCSLVIILYHSPFPSQAQETPALIIRLFPPCRKPTQPQT